MKYLFIYEKELNDYLKSYAMFFAKGFMYGSLYNINGHPAAVARNYHEKVNGKIYILENINFDYLDSFEGENYIRESILIYTETTIIPCWVYLLRKF